MANQDTDRKQNQGGKEGSTSSQRQNSSTQESGGNVQRKNRIQNEQNFSGDSEMDE